MEQIDVRILDRDYRLAVPADEKARLLDAVRGVDEKRRAIRAAGRVAGVDRIAVMA
ncbi:MAG: cell division protein ZapA, partial [Burkholderiales bacterium]